MAAIKNIIFDMGGVLYNIDYNLTADAFKALGFTNFEEMYSQFTADDVFEKLETGQITEEEFYKTIQQKSSVAITELQIQNAWNAMLLGFRTAAIEHLKAIKDDYRIFLLSNTNAIHLKKVYEHYETLNQEIRYDTLFEQAWYSNKIGYRKPNKDIYEFILNEAGLNAIETLFIDDSFNNIETAKALGIQTHLLLPNERIEDLHY
jgi:putative hydrolase of the HAD superfamily